MKIQTQAQLNIYKICSAATKENPATRERLMTATGMPDRTVRKEIELLRKNGLRICSTTGKAEYWLAKTEAEYKDFRRNYGSRLWEGMRTLQAMDNATEGQMELSEEK